MELQISYQQLCNAYNLPELIKIHTDRPKIFEDTAENTKFYVGLSVAFGSFNLII